MCASPAPEFFPGRSDRRTVVFRIIGGDSGPRPITATQLVLEGVPCPIAITTNRYFFEPMSKRRKGFPSETQVKRGVRIVNGNKLLEEKLGRNDLCPCGSNQRFKRCCLKKGRF